MSIVRCVSIIFGLLFIFQTGGVKGQEVVEELPLTLSDNKNVRFLDTTFLNNSPATLADYQPVFSKKQNKLKVNTTLGTSFSSDFAGGVGLNTFVNPNFSYAVRPEFRVRFGVNVNQVYLNNFGYDPYNQFKPFNGNAVFATFYVGGTYFVNDKLTISGDLYKTINMSAPPASVRGEKLNPNALNFDSYGGNVQLNYRISENTSIGASFSINKTNGYNPFLYPNNSGFYGGFGNPSGFGFQPRSFFNPVIP